MEIRIALEKMQMELRLRHYSPKTLKNYLRCAEFYLRIKGDLKFDDEHFKSFLVGKLDSGAAPETVNLYMNALKFFYREVLVYRGKIEFRFARRNLRLPVVLSREEIEKFLSFVENRKHKTMISLAYGAGLRVSEVVDLKVQDLDFENNLLYVREAKGGKDRASILPEKLRDILKSFGVGKSACDYLFESERGGKLTSRTLQKVFENILKKSGIPKSATFHSLRHSFATQCLENGVDIRYVQSLLGHANIKTTQRYTHVSRVKLAGIRSPL
jgi:site-specific recombinase XerD